MRNPLAEIVEGKKEALRVINWARLRDRCAGASGSAPYEKGGGES